MALVPQIPALPPQIQNAETVLLPGSFITTRQLAFLHFCHEEGTEFGIYQDLKRNMHQPLRYNRATKTETNPSLVAQVCHVPWPKAVAKVRAV